MHSARSTSSARATASARSASRSASRRSASTRPCIRPAYEGFFHYHDTQDELYFVHSGEARVVVEGEERILGPGGLFHVDSTTPRRVSNASETDDLVILVVGGKDGYVERDGHMVDEADIERRAGVRASSGATDRRDRGATVPSTPLSSCSPRSSNSSPEPTTRSFTVCETSTSDGRAAARRARRC